MAMELRLLVATVLLSGKFAAAAPLVPALFLFGDSLVDVGTNVLISGSPNKANFPPYGETYFKRPTGRFSNGRIIPDFLARFMGFSFLPPYLQAGANFSQGANFASAGSGILDSTNDVNNSLVPLSTQIQQFQMLVSTWNAAKVSKSMFVLITGSNDLVGGYILNQTAQQTYTPEEYIEKLVTEYKKSLEALYKTGARKIAIAGVGPLGCTPQLRLYAAMLQNITGCQPETNQLALAFNNALRFLFKNLTAELPDARFVYVKPYDFFMDMINHGSSYGFTVTESNCCGAGAFNSVVSCGEQVPPGSELKPFLCHRPSKYLFWDFHPTEQGCRFLTNRIWRGDASFVEPVNLRTLALAYI